MYSDQELIDVMLMAYAGLRNKRIVESLQAHGVNAVGLTGLDGAMVRGMRNKGIRVREGGKTLIKRDFSGKPVAVNRKLLAIRRLVESASTKVAIGDGRNENPVADVRAGKGTVIG